MTTPFYNATIRSVITAFGALFSDIHVIRRKGNSVTGKVEQDIKVPIAFSHRQKFFQMLNADPTKSTLTKITLPRMAYEIVGFTYDSTRKTTRSGTITCTTTDEETGTTVSKVYTPSPWNLELSLYVVGNNNEDVWQIIEQILPTFNSDYTIKMRNLNEIGNITNVPISLTSVGVQDDYQGSFEQDRIVVYTLSFVAKLAMYGGVSVSGTGIIETVNYNFEDVSGKPLESVEYDEEILKQKPYEVPQTQKQLLMNQSETEKPSYRYTEEKQLLQPEVDDK